MATNLRGLFQIQSRLIGLSLLGTLLLGGVLPMRAADTIPAPDRTSKAANTNPASSSSKLKDFHISPTPSLLTNEAFWAQTSARPVPSSTRGTGQKLILLSLCLASAALVFLVFVRETDARSNHKKANWVPWDQRLAVRVKRSLKRNNR